MGNIKKFLGTRGTFSTQSFHETKNITCGEGGSLFINDDNYIERAEIIFDKGTNRQNFLESRLANTRGLIVDHRTD